MTTRLEQEQREAEVRDKHDGWVGEFVAWIPMAIISAVLSLVMMIAMLAAEPGPMNLF